MKKTWCVFLLAELLAGSQLEAVPPKTTALSDNTAQNETGSSAELPDSEYSPSRLAVILKQEPAFRLRLEKLEKKFGRHLPYEHSRLAILRHFTGLYFEFLMKNGSGAIHSKIHQPEKQDIAWLIAEYPALETHLTALEAGKEEPLDSPRIIPDKKRITYSDGAFRQDGRPVFIIGTQGFFTLNPEVGFSICGWTFATRWEYAKGPEKNSSTGNAHLKKARRVAESGQFWDELYSGHARPSWLGKSNPKLRVGVGFYGLDMTHPVMWEWDRKTFLSVLPQLSQAENFLFLDLANEPAFNGATQFGAGEFRAFLMKRHGSIEKVNELWGTDYRQVDEIKIPKFVNRGWSAVNKQKRPETPVEFRQYIDWSDYNCWRVNDCFAYMVKMCHEMSPGTLTYTKIAAGYWLYAGIDPVMNVRTTDVSGSDAWWIYQAPRGTAGASDEMGGSVKVSPGYSVGWQTCLLHYDMMRSARPDAPIVNAEDHQFAGGFKPLSEKNPKVPSGHWDMPIPAAHFHSGQWQQAIHGKGMSIIWMHWPRHNVQDRAVATWGNSKAALDLNRLAREVNAFQTVRPQVKILLSRNAQLWGYAAGNGYWNHVKNTYEALSLNGVHIGFVFEEDLMKGKGPECRLLIAPAADQIDAAALATLKRSNVAIAAIGTESLTRDRYNRPNSVVFRPSLFRRITWKEFDSAPLDTMRKLLEYTETGPEIRLSVNGRPPWKLEWRSARIDNSILLNVCNYGQSPVTVSLSGEQNGEIIDLISREKIDPNGFVLTPQQVRLLAWKNRTPSMRKK